ncbi:disulfide bond formation protein DsbA [Acinetobacter sp. Ac_877]|uniref:DsbA family oxidoreductase n=1 Tax=Acinetobacter portensis TaxID=1839785 RepID=UPI00128B64FC|nr:DsbA family protein [Acinetobacter portensis]MPW42337.1 disulfide bond formation protein DsbA [Acinetobacter portensis]
MKIEFVFDVVYPFSYIAFQQLKKTWDQPNLHQVELLPVKMLPEISNDGLDILKYLKDKYGTDASSKKFDEVKFAAYEQDLVIDLEHMKHMPNSTLAHQAILAVDHRFDQFALTQAIFHANFVRGLDISKPEIMKEIIDGAGLDATKILRNIHTKDTVQQLQDIQQRIALLPSHPTPYYLVDDEIYELDGSTSALQNLLKIS